jgi:hypothetical protein
MVNVIDEVCAAIAVFVNQVDQFVLGGEPPGEVLARAWGRRPPDVVSGTPSSERGTAAGRGVVPEGRQ